MQPLVALVLLFLFSLWQPPAVPDNRRQAESLSLTREVSQSRNPSVSEHLPDEKVQLFSKMKVLQEKKQKMDKLLGELHTLRDQHLNNSRKSTLAAVRCRTCKYYGSTWNLVNIWWMNEYIVPQNYNFCGEIGLACEKILSKKAVYDKSQIGGSSVL